MQNQLDVNSWEECEERIQEIDEYTSTRHTDLLFRGQAKSTWPLETTLERRLLGQAWEFSKYCRLISRIKPAVETLTDRSWSTPSLREIETWCASFDSLRNGSEMLCYSYLAHLRHHGFPSPLLDWSSSPNVAAYFAFSRSQEDRVSIYVYCEMPKNIKLNDSNRPRIICLGPFVKTHRRHFIQQSSYTVCGQFDETWKFVSHQQVLEDIDLLPYKHDQDSVWKITVPVSERVKVLRLLDRSNINAFSLFDTEDSLMEMLATREIDLRDRLAWAQANRS